MIDALVTVLAPAFNEAANAASLVGFFREIRAAHPDLAFELVVVDDGSVDGTADLVLNALGERDTARVVRLSRNFGSHAALTAGLAHSRGDCVITVSTDRQEPLEAIGEFLAQWRAGADVVWGVRRTRAVPGGIADLMSRMFSRMFNRWSDVPTYPKDGPAQVLLSRAVVNVLNGMSERNRNIFGIIAWVGFRQVTVAFDQLPRPYGTSKWTTGKKIRLLVDSFVGFSSIPFLATLVLGGTLSVLGLVGGLALVIAALMTLSAPSGLGLVLATVFFVGGLQLAVLGALGEYLWRAGDDARRRPVYVLRDVAERGGPDRAGYGSRAVITDRSTV
jgi:dolichol-phosphate mannosyltransferase